MFWGFQNKPLEVPDSNSLKVSSSGSIGEYVDPGFFLGELLNAVLPSQMYRNSWRFSAMSIFSLSTSGKNQTKNSGNKLLALRFIPQLYANFSLIKIKTETSQWKAEFLLHWLKKLCCVKKISRGIPFQYQTMVSLLGGLLGLGWNDQTNESLLTSTLTAYLTRYSTLVHQGKGTEYTSAEQLCRAMLPLLLPYKRLCHH